MNQLQFRYQTAEGLALHPIVDGTDLLEGRSNDLGLDPDHLLPPTSRVLLPTVEPAEVVIGRCGCGEVGCGSFAVLIRRDGDDVLWEPTSHDAHETVSRTYRFALRNYLDAIDDAAANPPAGEGRGRRVARIVRVELARYEQKYGLDIFGRVDWVSSWPWDGDTVRVSLTRSETQTVHEFRPAAGDADRDFAARVIAEVDRLRFP